MSPKLEYFIKTREEQSHKDRSNSSLLLQQFRKDLSVYLPEVRQMLLFALICLHSFHLYHMLAPALASLRVKN